MNVSQLINDINIAKKLKEDQLLEIGTTVYDGYTTDLQSRSTWENRLDDWTKLALQIAEEKTYPWPKASNVKYPLLTTAAMQFSARAFPSLIPADGNIVKCKVVGGDNDGMKKARSERISKFMSYQLLEEMEGWEEGMDRMLMVLPIVGCVVKKTYYDTSSKQNCSHLIYPKDFVINYWTRDLKTAARVTQVYRMDRNTIKERINADLFLDVTLSEPTTETKQESVDTRYTTPANVDSTTPYIILEQHTWLDLDKDGYAEPYIVTIERDSKKVLRIVARFNQEGVVLGEDGKVVKIVPLQYYTKYGFIPNPEGGFYDIGFGLLLGSINESVNTIINQLVDAGSLANLQAGFLSKGLRVKLGESRFQPGEWKAVNATMDDLRKGVFPLPTRDPSNVLFQLLGTLIQSGKELASVSEIFVGKMPGQNTPATTTQATIEQGMKLFTAIFKRIFRSMTEEFRKLYKLNVSYLDTSHYLDVIDDQQGNADFQGSANDIVPAADPAATTDTEKRERAGDVMSLVQLGTVNPQEATKRFLQSRGVPDIDPLMQVPPPPPDPKQQEMQMKIQMEQQSHQLDMKMKEFELMIKQQTSQLDMQIKKMELLLEEKKMQMEEHRMNMEHRHAMMESAVKEHTTEKDLELSDKVHQQKMKQTSEKKETK